LVFPTQVKRQGLWSRTIFISANMEDGILTFGVRAGTTDERELDKIDSVLSYSSSLRMAVRLVLREAAFFGERKTFSFKFIRVARFLKDNAPHVFQLPRWAASRRTRWIVGSGTCWTRNIVAGVLLGER
jgi:hypothetical protein